MVLAAEIQDGYLIALIGVGGPALLGLLAWVFLKIGNHERDIAVMRQRQDDMEERVSELRAEQRGLR